MQLAVKCKRTLWLGTNSQHCSPRILLRMLLRITSMALIDYPCLLIRKSVFSGWSLYRDRHFKFTFRPLPTDIHPDRIVSKAEHKIAARTSSPGTSSPKPAPHEAYMLKPCPDDRTFILVLVLHLSANSEDGSCLRSAFVPCTCVTEG